MSNQTDNKDLPVAEVAKWLNTSFDQADPLRLAGLERLQRVHAIKETAFKREQARLSAKLGPNHPRVKALGVKLEANQQLQRDLALGISLARTPVVQADPNAWVLHGHVRDASFKGLSNLTVALYDEKNQRIEELGQASTDANSYFRLTIKSGARPKPEEPTDTKEVQEKLTRAAAGETLRRSVYIHVTNKEGATLYIDKDAVTPALGEVIYREIVLDGKGGEFAPAEGGKPTKPSRAGKDKGTPKGKSKR
jgi:hypothetical protein